MSLDKTAVHERSFEFLSACAKVMALCAEDDQQQRMVSCLIAQITRSQPRDFEPNSLPVLHNQKGVKDMRLAKEFREFAEYLPWQFSPRTVDQGKEMAIMDFNDLFVMDDIVTGLMYVDSGKTYPEHNHFPAEMYFLISGTGEWRFGGNIDYQSLTAGNVIYNHPWNWHGVRAGQAPLLALYLQVG